MTWGLAGEQNISQQQQQTTGRRNFLTRVIGRQVLFKKFFQSQPVKEPIDERQSADRPRAKRLVPRSGPMTAIVLVRDVVDFLLFLFVTHAVIFTAGGHFGNVQLGRKK